MTIANFPFHCEGIITLLRAILLLVIHFSDIFPLVRHSPAQSNSNPPLKQSRGACELLTTEQLLRLHVSLMNSIT